MDKTMVFGIVRHLLTVAGGAFVTKGYVDETGLDLIAGGAATLVGLAWSLIEKRATKKAVTLTNVRGVIPVLLLAALLGACAGDAQTRATTSLAIACSTYAATLEQLTPYRLAGKLGPSAIRRVDQANAATRPLCGSASVVDPATAVTAVQQAVQLLTTLKGGL